MDRVTWERLKGERGDDRPMISTRPNPRLSLQLWAASAMYMGGRAAPPPPATGPDA